MNDLIQTVSELLANQTVDVFIGYGKGSTGRIRPVIIRKPSDTRMLVTGEDCTQNLANYLLKKEIRAMGRIGFQAGIASLRSVIQLAAENQIKEGQVVGLILSDTGPSVLLETFGSMEAMIAESDTGIPKNDRERIEQIESMNLEERWKFWQAEFDKCIKCYACRAACPMCYCQRCTTDVNQPQWIPVASHARGNLAFHLMRAMHLAGRCINCGECARACPMDIPVNLLTYQLIGPIEETFGSRAGMKTDSPYAFSTFKPDDQENFIL